MNRTNSKKSDKSDVLGELISTYSAPISALDCLIQVSYININCSKVSNNYIFIIFRLQEHPQTDLGCCSVLKVEADILNSDYSSLGNSLSGLASLKHVRIEKFKKIHPTTIYGRQYSVVTSTLYPRFHWVIFQKKNVRLIGHPALDTFNCTLHNTQPGDTEISSHMLI